MKGQTKANFSPLTSEQIKKISKALFTKQIKAKKGRYVGTKS
jgi:hypothetical protein